MENELNGQAMNYGSLVLRKPTPSRPQPAALPAHSNVENLYKDADSPMSLMSTFLGEHDSERSYTNLLAGAASSPTSDGDGKSSGMEMEGMSMGSRASSSFAERLAARSAVGMNGNMESGRDGIARYKSDSRITMPPSRISMPRPGYQLTIPPGLSPTMLLDSPSPVLLATTQHAEPSPTTGTFPLPPFFPGEMPPKDKTNDQGSSPGFVFKPYPKPPAQRNTVSPLAGMGQQSYKPLNQMHFQSQAATQASVPTSSALVAASHSGQGSSLLSSSIPASSKPVAVALSVPPLQSMQLSRQQIERTIESQQAQSPEQEQQQVTVAIPAFVERPSEDGYNWRKYGQKQVKGSEYPRSYYKCTQPNCPMKKKVERSHDGQVTEIVYKGEHNHPKPQPTRRLSVAAAHLMSEATIRDAGDREGSDSKEWGGFQTGAGGEGGSGLFSMIKNERGSLDDPSSSHRGRTNLGMSIGGTPEPSSPSTSDDEDGSKLSNEDGDDDEPDSKRRKKDKKAKELPPAPRTIREPRVVVQTTSEIDVLDDGYRWRKYGQKVVKGNPHPRSYYKCTNVGCPVRKHVERASNDVKAVITTYEGKHNHDVPVARNSSHDSAGAGTGGSSAPSQSIVTSAAPSASGIQQQQDRFGRRMSVFGRLLEDGSNKGDGGSAEIDLGMGVGMSQGNFNMDVSSSNPAVSDNKIPCTSISMNLSSLGAMMSDGRRSMLGIESYIGSMHGQDMSLRPKQEQEDAHSHNSSNSMQLNRASANSSLYHQSLAPRLMLGP